MMYCTKYNKPRAWLSVLLVAVSMLICVNNTNAQQLDVSILTQLTNKNIDPLSGLPTLTEIASTKVSAQVKQIITQLDSLSFAEREAAAQLLVSQNIDRRQICKVLSGNDLSLEQRHRLVDWLRNDLITTPHAAIGISVRRTSNIIIVDVLIEDLPAIEVLKPGDQIIKLDGLPMLQWTQFLRSISSRKPGDKVKLTVKRSFEPDGKNDDQELEVKELDFDIILGSDEYLINSDGTKQVNTYVRQAIARDLKTITKRYAPKILLIKGGEAPKINLGTTADK